MKKYLVLLFLFIVNIWFCGAQKQELIENVLHAIENSEGASYESITTIEVPTPADTTMVVKFLTKFTYVICDYDTLYKMNFRYDKREKTFNFDRLKSLVYNGQHYYSVEKINENIIPAPKYQLQQLSGSSGKTALEKSIEGQIPFIYKYLGRKTTDELILKPDTIYEQKSYRRLSFMADPIYEFEVWFDKETYMPASVIKIAHINRKRPKIIETSMFDNFQFYKTEKGEIAEPFIINQFSVNEQDIKYIPDEYKTIPKLLPPGTTMPEINGNSVFDTLLYLNGTNQKVKLIFFGMINCSPCIKSIPHLKKISEIFMDDNKFEMMAFYPYDPPSVLKKYAIKEKINFPVCAGNKEVIKAFGLHAYPDILLVNQSGKVHKWYNYSEDLSENIIGEINKLLNN